MMETGYEAPAPESRKSDRRSVVAAVFTAGFAVLFAIAFFPAIESMRPEQHFLCLYGGKKLETFVVAAIVAAIAGVVLLLASAGARPREARWSATHIAWTVAPSLWIGIAAGALFLARTTTWSLTLGPMCGF